MKCIDRLKCNSQPVYLLSFAVRYRFLSQGSDYDKFVKVAQKNEDATFLQTKDKTVAKEAGLKDHGIAVITNFEGEQGDARESCVLASCCMGRCGSMHAVLVAGASCAN